MNRKSAVWYMSMKKLTLEEIKKRELGILVELNEFCKRENLRLYLTGGTLLGAIRHKGFIPWDDDIDVCMPRPDYERLVKIFHSKKNLQMRSSLLGNLDAPFSKLGDFDTSVRTKYSAGGVNDYLWVDILPIDGLPEDVNEVRNIYDTCRFWRRVLLLQQARLGEGTSLFRKYAKIPMKLLASIWSTKTLLGKLEQFKDKYAFEESDYVGCVAWGLYGVGERLEKKEFLRPVEVEFEGISFPTFSCWEKYLSGVYGDYMQLPPEDKRVAHDMEVWVKED